MQLTHIGHGKLGTEGGDVVLEEHRRSARLAKKEAPAWVSMETKAIRLRALRDALSGCSPRLKSRVTRDRLLDSVIAPMGMKPVSDLRIAASIPVAAVAPDGDV